MGVRKLMHFKNLSIVLLIFSLLLIGYNLFLDEFDEGDAIKKATKYHNTSVEKASKIDFPIMKSGQTISKEVLIGGPPGNKTILDMSVSVNTENNKYIVTLYENWNIGDGEISYWKYEVTKKDIILIDKYESLGVHVIK